MRILYSFYLKRMNTHLDEKNPFQIYSIFSSYQCCASDYFYARGINIVHTTLAYSTEPTPKN